jgi:hypothetical protein
MGMGFDAQGLVSPLLSTSTQEPLEVGLSVCTMAHQVERSVNRFNMDKGVA